MTIATGTVNAGTAALNALALVNDIGAAIAAHPSWDFVARVNGASVAGRFTDVYQNPTTGAYLGLMYSATGATSFSAFIFEGFSTPNATKFVPTPAANQPHSNMASAGDDSYQAFKHVADGTSATANLNGNIFAPFVSTAVATGMGWMASITNERIVITVQNVVNAFYLGLAEKPVGSRWRWEGCYGVPGGSLDQQAVNRTAYGKMNYTSSFINGDGRWIPATARDVNLDKYVYSKILVINAEAIFGTLRDLIIFMNTIGAGYGDDVTLDGVNYTHFGGSYWVRTDA